MVFRLRHQHSSKLPGWLSSFSQREMLQRRSSATGYRKMTSTCSEISWVCHYYHTSYSLTAFVTERTRSMCFVFDVCRSTFTEIINLDRATKNTAVLLKCRLHPQHKAKLGFCKTIQNLNKKWNELNDNKHMIFLILCIYCLHCALNKAWPNYTFSYSPVKWSCITKPRSFRYEKQNLMSDWFVFLSSIKK